MRAHHEGPGETHDPPAPAAGGGVAYGVDLGGASVNVVGGSRRESVGPDEGITVYSTITMNANEFDLVVG